MLLESESPPPGPAADLWYLLCYYLGPDSALWPVRFPRLSSCKHWKYPNNGNSGYTSMRATVICCALLLLLGGLEALLILTLRVCILTNRIGNIWLYTDVL